MAGSPTRPAGRALAEVHRAAHEGEDLGRILALSDGVFGFALTLLALALVVPAGVCLGIDTAQCAGPLGEALNHDGVAFASYALTFLIIAAFWVSHHRVYRFIRRYDSTLLWLNLLFLMTIAVAPFVLGVLNAYPRVLWAVVLFSIEQSAASTLIAAIWFHAVRANLLTADADAAVVTYFKIRSVVVPAAFLAAIPVAFLSPLGAEGLWVAGFVVLALLRRSGWIVPSRPDPDAPGEAETPGPARAG